jgi:hypothetical protein
MISREDVDRLCERDPTPEDPVLSVYLDVDQSRTANRNGGFRAALRARLRVLESQVAAAERPAFRAAAAGVEAVVDRHEPHAKTLVLVAGGRPALAWSAELAAGLASHVHWAPVPIVRPLLEALDRHRRHAVVLASKERARLLSVFLGEVEEEREAEAEADVHHKRASGTDHVRSQMHFQRQDELHVRWHLRHVVALLDDLARARPIEWLVLCGPSETTNELAGLLPPRLADRVAGMLRLPIDAPPADVVAAVLPVVEHAEGRADASRVQAVLDGATVGLEAALAALRERRAQMVVYAEGFTAPGSECPSCHGLFSAEVDAACPYDAVPLLAYDDVVDRALARAAGWGAVVEPVRGDAAARLAGAGGIGVVRRF